MGIASVMSTLSFLLSRAERNQAVWRSKSEAVSEVSRGGGDSQFAQWVSDFGRLFRKRVLCQRLLGITGWLEGIATVRSRSDTGPVQDDLVTPHPPKGLEIEGRG